MSNLSQSIKRMFKGRGRLVKYGILRVHGPRVANTLLYNPLGTCSSELNLGVIGGVKEGRTLVGVAFGKDCSVVNDTPRQFDRHSCYGHNGRMVSDSFVSDSRSDSHAPR